MIETILTVMGLGLFLILVGVAVICFILYVGSR